MVCLKKRRPTSVSEVPTHFKVAPRDAARGWERPKPSLGQANGDAGVVQRVKGTAFWETLNVVLSMKSL